MPDDLPSSSTGPANNSPPSDSPIQSSPPPQSTHVSFGDLLKKIPDVPVTIQPVRPENSEQITDNIQQTTENKEPFSRNELPSQPPAQPSESNSSPYIEPTEVLPPAPGQIPTNLAAPATDPNQSSREDPAIVAGILLPPWPGVLTKVAGRKSCTKQMKKEGEEKCWLLTVSLTMYRRMER